MPLDDLQQIFVIRPRRRRAALVLLPQFRLQRGFFFFQRFNLFQQRLFIHFLLVPQQFNPRFPVNLLLIQRFKLLLMLFFLLFLKQRQAFVFFYHER